MALAMIRWVIDNKRYDEKYLRNANKAAAGADKEPSFSNSTWLVKLEKDGSPGKFLRGSEVGAQKENARKLPAPSTTSTPSSSW
jgi:tetrathionate reductase subunit A